MSCYNWEQGTITIPAKEWAGFRTTLIKAWNEYQLSKLDRAKKAHAELTAAIKGKRGKKRGEALAKAVEARFPRKRDGFAEDADHDVRYLVVTGWGENMTLKPLPKKKDFKILPTSKSGTLDLKEATITLENETRTVTWSVGENNRAVERARKEKIAQKMFAMLNKITWTRGSGGTIVGNDEYNRDADYAGGGGNYVTAEYSQEKQRRDRRLYAQTRNDFRQGYGSYRSRF